MTKAKIDWLLPSTPESLLMLDDPVEGLRPKWLPPGVVGDVLQIDAGGNLAWGESPAAMHWPLRAPNGTATDPSYGFDSLQGTGMTRNLDGEGDLNFVVKDEPVLTLFSYGPWGLVSLVKSTLTFAPDNSADIGIGGGNPRNIYAGTSFRAPNGTAAAPSYTFAGFPAIGMYSVLGRVNFVTNDGAEAMFAGMPGYGTQWSISSNANETSIGLAATIDGGYVVVDATGIKDFTIYPGPTETWRFVSAGGALRPGANNAYDLGDATHQIRDLYLAGQIFVDGAPFGLSWPLLAPNGTEGAPSYTFASDLDTGLFRNGVDDLRLTVGGNAKVAVLPTATWLIGSNLLFYADNTFDLGPGNLRPRDVYIGRNLSINGGTFGVGTGTITMKPGVNPSGIAGTVALNAAAMGGGLVGLRILAEHNGGVLLGPLNATIMAIQVSAPNGAGVIQLYASNDGNVAIGSAGGVGGRIGIDVAGITSWAFDVGGTFRPWANNAYDLGTAAQQVRNLYLAGQILVNGVPLTALTNPMTQPADLIVGSTGGAATRLAKGATVGHVLTITGASSLGWMAAPGTVGSVGWPLLAPDGTLAAPSYSFAASPNTGMNQSGGSLVFAASGNRMVSIGFGGTYIDSGLFAIRDLAGAATTGVYLRADADNVLAQRNGPSNPQTFILYESYNGPSDWSGIKFTTTGTVNQITSAVGGTGTPRSLLIGNPTGMGNLNLQSGSKSVIFDPSGLFFPSPDNAIDLGFSAYRFRNFSYSGQIFAPDGSAAAPSYAFASGPVGLYALYTGRALAIAIDGVASQVFNTGAAGDIQIASPGRFMWADGPNATNTVDVLLSRDGPGILAQKNGANAQVFRLYYNAAYLELRHESWGSQIKGPTDLILDAGASLHLRSSGANQWYLPPGGNLYPISDNTHDIGDSGTQVRDLSLGGAVKWGGDTFLSRDGAGILAQKNGANPQEMRIYGSASEYLRLTTSGFYGLALNAATATPLIIQNNTAEHIYFQTTGSSRWLISSNGHLFGAADNAFDIGASGVLRPRSIYAGTSILTPLVDYTTGAAPATPASGHVVTYAKTDKRMYAKDDAGVERLLGGATGVSVVNLWLENARFPDGSANNAFPLPVERVSTGTPGGSGAPKVVTLTYQYDATTFESLIWKIAVPSDYAGGAVTLVTKWSMVSATSGGIRPTGALEGIIDGTTDVRALAFTTVSFAADVAVPGTLGRQVEVRQTLTGVNLAAGRAAMASIGMWLATGTNAAGDRVLEAAWLEFAR